jgi:hypothetical protein
MNFQTSKFLTPKIGQIPHALKALDRWFVWKAVPNGDRVDKGNPTTTGPGTPATRMIRLCVILSRIIIDAHA